MKALTIKQPWASLIVEGIKDIENRTWRTNYRGRIYVHCSKPTKFDVKMTDPQTIAAMPVLKQAFDGTMPFGAIIGEVDIIDCVQNHPSAWAEQGAWNWVLANPVKYDRPILNVKGALSFWKFRKEAGL